MQIDHFFKEKLALAQSVEELLAFRTQFETDDRKSVQAIVLSADKKRKALEAELARINEMKKYEREYAAFGAICGIDEVGSWDTGR